MTTATEPAPAPAAAPTLDRAGRPQWTDATGYTRHPAPLKVCLALISKAAGLGSWHYEWNGTHGDGGTPCRVADMLGLVPGAEPASPEAWRRYLAIGNAHNWTLTRDNAAKVAAACLTLVRLADDPASGVLRMEDNRQTPAEARDQAATLAAANAEAEAKRNAEDAAKAARRAAWLAQEATAEAPADLPRVPVPGCPGLTVPEWTQDTARAFWPYGTLSGDGDRVKGVAGLIRERWADAIRRGLVMPCNLSVRSDHNHINAHIVGFPGPFHNPERAVYEAASPRARLNEGPRRYLPAVEAAQHALAAIVGLYHWDKSDSMTDYFHCRFYHSEGIDWKAAEGWTPPAWMLARAARPAAEPAPQAPAPTPARAGAVTYRHGAHLERHTHTKKGRDMHLVVISSRLSREDWEALTHRAKATGGWYSRAWGQTPGGWAWWDEAPALAFLAAQFGTDEPGPAGEACGTCEPETCGCGTCPDGGTPADKAPPTPAAKAPPTPAAKAGAGDRIRGLADSLDAEADRKRGPRLENTPKRQREAGSARVDGDRAARAASYLRAYADALEAGTLPACLRGWRPTKAAALDVARQTLRESGGYYAPPVESGVYSNHHPQAVALRDLAEGAKGAADREREAEAARAAAKAAGLVKFRNTSRPGFFPTPPDIAAQAARLLLALCPAEPVILEPSAGLGALVDAVMHARPFATVDAIEDWNEAADYCRAHSKAARVDCADFLTVQALPVGKYDGVILNPPFERNQALAHVAHACRMIRPGGVLVAIVPAGFLDRHQAALPAGDWEAHTPDEGEGFNSRKAAIRQTGVSVDLVRWSRPLDLD
jgi:hypothetical protein